MINNLLLKKSESFFGKLTYIFAIFIFSIIFIFSFIFDSSVYYKQNKFISLVFCIFILLLWFIIYRFLNKKLKDKVSRKKHIITLIVYFVIVSIIQLFIYKNLLVNPDWDYGVIFSNAKYYLANGHRHDAVYKEYFQFFPNNILLFLNVVKFIKIGSLFSLSAFKSCIVFNILFLDFGLLILYLTLNKKFNYKVGVFGLIITLFFLPIFLYTPIFYSDTLSFFIGISFVYLYLFVDKENVISRKNIILFCLIGLLLFLGKEIKITSVFVFIAILFNYIFSMKNIKIFVNIFVSLICFFVLSFLFKCLIVNNPKYEFKVNKYGSYPFTHWIMMGVEDVKRDNSSRNSYGGYSIKDSDYTKKWSTSKEASKHNIKEFKRRIKNMGFGGYIVYLLKKSVNAWSDGFYFSDVALSRNRANENSKVYKILFENHSTKFLFINFTQGVQFAFIISMITLSFIKLKNKDIRINYVLLSILGLFVFLLFWENRSRYIFNFIPLFILIICYNYNEIGKKLKIN